MGKAAPLAMALIFAAVVLPPAASAQPGDTFHYDPQAFARQQVRDQIVASVYGCAKSIAFGDINGGARSRSVVKRDPRLINCFNLLLNSNWFRREEKLPLWDKIIDRAIDAVIAGDGP